MINDLSLQEIQARILAGEHFTEEEYREIIKKFREDRQTVRKAKQDFDLMSEIDAIMGEK